MAPLAEFRALDRRIWFLAAARLVVTAGFSMVLPFLAIHLTVERNVPAVVVGLIWTVAGACGAAMQWFAGELSDRIGRRQVLILSMFLRAANLAGLGWATATLASPVTFGALVVGNAVLRAFFDPVANALVADLAPPEQRVSAFALQRVGVNIGWSLGTGLAALATMLSYSALFYWSVPVTLIAAATIWGIHEPRTSVKRATAPRWSEMVAFLEDKLFVRFLLSTIAFFILQVQLYQTLSIYAARSLHLDRTEVLSLYTLNGLLVVCLQLPAVSYIRRIGTRGALVLGCFIYAAAYASAGLATGYISLLFCVAAVTLAEIVTAPAQQVTVSALAPPGRIGAYSGLFGLCQVVGQSAGPLIGTTALDAVPARVSWFLLALFGVAAAVGYKRVVTVATPKEQPGTTM